MTDIDASVPEGQIRDELWAEFEADDALKAKASQPEEQAPAPEPVDAFAMPAEESVQPQDTAPATEQAPEPQDPWAGVPAALREEFEAAKADRARLEQRIRSDEGRVAAYQRRLEELRKQAAPAAAPKQQVSATERLTALANDYPEIAQPLKEALAPIEGRLDELDRAEESRRTAARSELESVVQDQTSHLEREHPDWLTTLQQNGPAFAAWVEDQPRRIRDAAQRNANVIVDAAEAGEVVAQFKQFLRGPAPAPAQQAAPVTIAAQPQTQPLNDRRARQLDATASPQRSGRQSAVSGIPADGDPQAIWDAFDRSERQRA